MGLPWSRPQQNEIEYTSIDSPPTASLYEPINLTIALSPGTRKYARSLTGNVSAEWEVVFEIDVAHMQRRQVLYCVNTDFSHGVEHLCIPSDAIRKVCTNDVTTDELCNVCALHISLRVGDQLIVEDTIVLDISRGGYDERTTADLQRRIYGFSKE